MPADFIVGKAYTNFLNNVPLTQILSVGEDGRVLRNWREARNNSFLFEWRAVHWFFYLQKILFEIVFLKPIVSPIARLGPGPSP